MGAQPDRRMWLLVRLRLGQRLVKAPVLAVVGHFVLRPGLEDDVHGLDAHLAPLSKRQLPAAELVDAWAVAEPELEAPARELVDHGRVLASLIGWYIGTW